MPIVRSPLRRETRGLRANPQGMANRDLMRSVGAGLAGGIAGAFSMDLVSAGWSLARRGKLPTTEASLFQHGGRPDVEEAKQQGKASGDREAVATTKLAEKAGEAILDRPRTPRERHWGGVATHYLYGAAAGARSTERWRHGRRWCGPVLGRSMGSLRGSVAAPASASNVP